MNDLLIQAFIYLCAAVIAVPIARRFGLGSVLGYLIAGVVIGPITGIVGSETETLQHFAEFGVVMMLFLVGLELEPKMLWKMRGQLLGLGGLQVVITTGLVMAVASAFGFYWSVALAIGLILALSSTAVVLQTYSEKNLTRTAGGRAGFSVLLFQDIAVIPMLALIPLLALPELVDQAAAELTDDGDHAGSEIWIAHLPGWAYALVALSAVAFVILAGQFLTRPLFRFVAESRLPEIFTAMALLLMIGIELLMGAVGLSPALGAFLAGVVLANSEFRHELESNIEPFKGMLLGLFFITVGAGIDFNVLFADFWLILALTLGLMVLKFAVLFGLGNRFKLNRPDHWLFALSLSQAGEFGFVLLNLSFQNHVLPVELMKILSLVVAISMLLTPVLFIFFDRIIQPRLARGKLPQDADNIEEHGKIIVAGVGRFGQIVYRLLNANQTSMVVLDHDSQTIERMRKFGVKAYFGDATRPDLLHAAGIEEAKVLVIAIDDQDAAVELAQYVKHAHPQVKIVARAFDRLHYYHLRAAGADVIIKELFSASLTAAKEVLKLIGAHPYRVERIARSFHKHDDEGTDFLYNLWNKEEDMLNNPEYIREATQRGDMINQVLQETVAEVSDEADRGWTPPPRGYEKEILDQS